MERPRLPVIADGDGWLIIGKPPNLITHRTKGSADREAALQWVRDQVGQRVYPVHRLDRPASGCLLFGIDKDLAGSLHGALREDDAEKHYLVLVRGCIPVGSETVIERELDGKPCRTDVWVLGSSMEPRCSLLLCRIHTGRFHQIRRHLAKRGHPVLGDSAHGDTRVNRAWREQRGLPRLMLHAWRLSAVLDGQQVDARCPIWPDMARVLRSLPFWDEAVAREPLLAEGWSAPPPAWLGEQVEKALRDDAAASGA